MCRNYFDIYFTWRNRDTLVVNYVCKIIKLQCMHSRIDSPFFPSMRISINNQVAVHCQCINGARIDLDYGPEFRGAICGQPNPVHLLFKQWQSIYWNVRADRNSNNCIYRTEYIRVRDRRACVCTLSYSLGIVRETREKRRKIFSYNQ